MNTFHQQSVFQSIFSKFLLNIPQSDHKDIYRICCHCQKAYYYYYDVILTQSVQDWGQSRMLFLKKLKKFAQKFKINTFCSINPELILQKMSEIKPVCGAIIFNLNETKVLVVKTRNKLGFPKGKINQFETPEQCASREVKEEVGLFIHNRIDPLKKIQFVTRQSAQSTFFLVNEVSQQQTIRIDKNQIDDAFWIKISDLNKQRLRLVERSRQAWDLYLKQCNISQKTIKFEDFINEYYQISKSESINTNNEIKLDINPLLTFKFDRQKLMSVFHSSESNLKLQIK